MRTTDYKAFTCKYTRIDVETNYSHKLLNPGLLVLMHINAALLTVGGCGGSGGASPTLPPSFRTPWFELVSGFGGTVRAPSNISSASS